MGAIELRSAYDRIQLIVDWIKHHPQGGPMAQAIQIYTTMGKRIRERVYAKMDHYPEDFEFPRARITGKESEKMFKPTEHQPRLM